MGEGAKGLEVKAGGANTSPRGSIKRTCRAAETHHWYFSHVHGMDIGMCRLPELGGVPCLPLLYRRIRKRTQRARSRDTFRHLR